MKSASSPAGRFGGGGRGGRRPGPGAGPAPVEGPLDGPLGGPLDGWGGRGGGASAGGGGGEGRFSGEGRRELAADPLAEVFFELALELFFEARPSGSLGRGFLLGGPSGGDGLRLRSPSSGGATVPTFGMMDSASGETWRRFATPLAPLTDGLALAISVVSYCPSAACFCPKQLHSHRQGGRAHARR